MLIWFVATIDGLASLATGVSKATTRAAGRKGAAGAATEAAEEAVTSVDHVVLGKSLGLAVRAEKVGGRHLMACRNWVAELQAAIANLDVPISVVVDDLAGYGSLYSRVMQAIQRHAGHAPDRTSFDM